MVNAVYKTSAPSNGFGGELACQPAYPCVHDLFELQAAQTPDAAALIAGDRSMTYACLDERAEYLAHSLRSRGIGPDVPVAIAMQRGFDAVVSILAVLKAGGAYVPIDPSFPASRIRTMLEVSGARLLLTTENTPLRLDGIDISVCIVDRDWDMLVECVETESAPEPSAENLAYIVFTSGSTGAPKGIGMPHRVLASLVQWQIAESALALGGRTLQFASLSFDVSFQEIFSTLCAGGTLVMIDDDVRRDPAKLLTTAAAARVERLFLPYVALKQLADAAQYAAIVPSTLREVITAGERLQVTPPLVWFFKKLPHCRLRNQYGPSETHVVTQYTLEGEPALWPALPPIGTAIPSAQTAILVSDMKSAVAGEIGELYLGGICVARGYIGSAELTAERFVTLSSVGERGVRWYRTGDLARVDEHGDIEFMGRADDQIKIRGYRVEPAEIEQVLCGHPSIAQAAVIARTGTGDEPRLTAFIVARPGHVPDVGALSRHLETALPAYMVPTEYVPLDSLPSTPTGKVDRRALGMTEHTAIVRRARYAPPQREIEREIAALWTEILGVESPGLYDSFFDLGGTSVLAVQAHRRLQTIVGREFSITEIFQHATISALARYFSAGPESTASGGGDIRDRAARQRAAQARAAAPRRRLA